MSKAETLIAGPLVFLRQSASKEMLSVSWLLDVPVEKAKDYRTQLHIQLVNLDIYLLQTQMLYRSEL